MEDRPEDDRIARFLSLLPHVRIKNKGGEIELSSIPTTKPKEKVDSLKVLEYWLQEYVNEHHERLGFKHVKGPYDRGPDFEVLFDGRWVKAEAEVRYRSYVDHGHHEDRAFADVRVLIVLEEGEPPQAIEDQLPPHIVHVNQSDFTPWYEKRSREYAAKMRNSDPEREAFAFGEYLKGEIHRRWLAACPQTSRDLACCPDCNVCPYFGSGQPGDADWKFTAVAKSILEENPEPSDDFIDEFFDSAAIYILAERDC